MKSKDILPWSCFLVLEEWQCYIELHRKNKTTLWRIHRVSKWTCKPWYYRIHVELSKERLQAHQTAPQIHVVKSTELPKKAEDSLHLGLLHLDLPISLKWRSQGITELYLRILHLTILPISHRETRLIWPVLKPICWIPDSPVQFYFPWIMLCHFFPLLTVSFWRISTTKSKARLTSSQERKPQ